MHPGRRFAGEVGDLELDSGISTWTLAAGSGLVRPLGPGKSAALEVLGSGRLEFDSPLLDPNPDATHVALRVRVPRGAATSRWGGELLLFVADPGSPTGFRYVEGKSLTSLERGVFEPIAIPIPAKLKAHFSQGPVRVRCVLKVPEGSSAYHIDQLELTGSPKTVARSGGAGATATQTVTIALPSDASLSNTVLFGNAKLDVRDGTLVSGGPGLEVVSSGQQVTEIGSDARIQGDVRSVGSVFLRDRATVTGDLLTQGTFSHQSTWTVQGELQQGIALTPTAQVSFDVAFPPATEPVFVGVDQARTLSPGSFADVSVHPRGTLNLSSGEYFFQRLSVESQGSLSLSTQDGPVTIFVKNGLTYRGSMGQAAPEHVLVVHTGTNQVEIDAPFRGTLIATSSPVRLGPNDGGGHDGAFFGAQLSAEARNPIRHVPYAHWDELLRGDAPIAHASPTSWIRARWIYPDGEPLTSFSYAPLPAPSGNNIVFFSHENNVEDPTEALSFEIENLPQAEAGREVAYSVTMKSWGLGNFYFDVPIASADPNVTLAPGETVTIDIPSLKDTLGVKATDMPAKGDIVIGLHRLVAGGGVEPEPFLYLRLPQFFYHFSDDLSEVYTYSLEKADPVLAPAGMGAKDGVVERYAQGDYHANLFEPGGYLGAMTSAEARTMLLDQFQDRPAALFGIRWDTHDDSALPGSVIPPGATPGGFNDPYDPSHGPTPVCATWPTTFVDNGPEPFPIRSTNEFAGIVDFLPAAFNRVQLFKADGTLVVEGHFDQHGCLPAQELGRGNYLMRVFTDGITSDGVRIDVRRFEPPEAAGEDRAVSVTYALLLEDPGNTNPFGTVGFTVTTGMWNHTTHVAGFASHLLARDAAGADFGFTKGTAAAPKVYPFFVDTASISNFNGAALEINAFLQENTWVSDARWKFVLGHEFGHMVQGFAKADLPARYTFSGNTSIQGWSGLKDPDSAAGVDGCNCEIIEPGNNQLHCLQSIEIAASAAQEGYGHFMGARVWSKLPGEDGFSGCNFSYYKQVSSPELVSEPLPPPMSIACDQAYNHRGNQCNNVTISGEAAGSEIDWLTFFWAVTTDAAHPVTVGDIFSWYRSACGGIECDGSVAVTFPMLKAGAPAGLRDWLQGLAEEHGVN